MPFFAYLFSSTILVYHQKYWQELLYNPWLLQLFLLSDLIFVCLTSLLRLIKSSCILLIFPKILIWILFFCYLSPVLFFLLTTPVLQGVVVSSSPPPTAYPTNRLNESADIPVQCMADQWSPRRGQVSGRWNPLWGKKEGEERHTVTHLHWLLLFSWESVGGTRINHRVAHFESLDAFLMIQYKWKDKDPNF